MLKIVSLRAMDIDTILFIHKMFCTYGVFCYVMGGGGGGTVVSVYSFCILYVLLFDDFLQ